MRGVARSGQVQCWNDKEYSAAADAARGVPGPGALRGAIRQGLDFATACQQRSTDLVPFIGTGSNAKDIDLLRQAPGEEALTFYGRSFGSYVGTVPRHGPGRGLRTAALRRVTDYLATLALHLRAPCHVRGR